MYPPVQNVSLISLLSTEIKSMFMEKRVLSLEYPSAERGRKVDHCLFSYLTFRLVHRLCTHKIAQRFGDFYLLHQTPHRMEPSAVVQAHNGKPESTERKFIQ